MQSPPPPPPVFMSPSDAVKFFAEMPTFDLAGKKYVLFAITAYGTQADLASAKLKLSGLGWESQFATDREGKQTLLIATNRKTVADTQLLGQQARDGLLGAVQLKPVVFDAPTAGK